MNLSFEPLYRAAMRKRFPSQWLGNLFSSAVKFCRSAQRSRRPRPRQEGTLIVQEQVYAFFRADQLDQVMVVLHSTAHGFLQIRQLIFQGVYFRFLMRADLEHSDFLLFAHKPYPRFQNWDGIVHEIFLNCKPFFAQNSCRSGALVIDYFPLKCLCQSLKISPLSTFHRFSRQIPWAPLRIANEHSFPITNITVTLSLNVYKK